MQDGIGVSLDPPVENSQIALSGFMNLLGGSSRDGRQTLDEFAASHRRIITELYDKKQIQVTWEKDQEATLAGFPAKRLAFTYQDDRRNAMLEVHIVSLGRNEGCGVRIKIRSWAGRKFLSVSMTSTSKRSGTVPRNTVRP